MTYPSRDKIKFVLVSVLLLDFFYLGSNVAHLVSLVRILIRTCTVHQAVGNGQVSTWPT